jgi:hypothetical protein
MAVVINGTTGVSGVDGSAGTPAVQGTDTNTGIFYPAADTIAFAEGGVEVARINSDAQFVASAGTASLPVYTTTGDTNTGIFFPAADTIAFAEGGTEAMRIDSSGNVGIGSASPTTYVDGSRGLVVETSSGRSGLTFVGNHSTADEILGRINFTDSGSTNTSYRNAIIDGIRGANDNSAYLVFSTSNSGNAAERMRITSAGLMLLGVTSTLGGQTAYLTTRGTASDVGITVGVTNNGYNAMKFLNQDNTVVGSIVNNSGGTAFNTTSDYRLKENVAPMTGALATVSALKPCTYTWKADGAAGQGFIAHELQAIVPDAVSGAKDATETYTDDNGVEQTRPKYQGVDTSYLVATLTAAIQELKAELDTTKARLAALEAQ